MKERMPSPDSSNSEELEKIKMEMLGQREYKNLSMGDPVLDELAKLRLAWRKSGKKTFEERDHMLE